MDLNCCQPIYGQSLEEKIQKSNKIQSIINKHKVNFNKLFLPAKWKLSRYEKIRVHAGARDPYTLLKSFFISEKRSILYFPLERGAGGSINLIENSVEIASNAHR